MINLSVFFLHITVNYLFYYIFADIFTGSTHRLVSGNRIYQYVQRSGRQH